MLHRRLLIALLAGGVALAPLALRQASAATPRPVERIPLTFNVTVAPEGVLGVTTCKITADLYRPAGATKATPVPAILTTNGFGGSKADQANIGQGFGLRGYTVLSYSGLGFGGSGCKITLDDRDHDGTAASQLIRWLGGDPAVVATRDDTGQPYAVDFVQLDTNRGLAHDPRVGMIGGSYGGQIQYATAAVEPFDGGGEVLFGIREYARSFQTPRPASPRPSAAATGTCSYANLAGPAPQLHGDLGLRPDPAGHRRGWQLR